MLRLCWRSQSGREGHGNLAEASSLGIIQSFMKRIHDLSLGLQRISTPDLASPSVACRPSALASLWGYLAMQTLRPPPTCKSLHFKKILGDSHSLDFVRHHSKAGDGQEKTKQFQYFIVIRKKIYQYRCKIAYSIYLYKVF